MTYYAREHTDPAGGALTITTDHQGAWITATEGRDEVTVGPFPVSMLELAGSYTRTDEPVDPEGDTRTREHLLAEEHRLLGLEKSLRAHLSRTVDRAEKAEHERDARDAAAHLWKETARRLENRRRLTVALEVDAANERAAGAAREAERRMELLIERTRERDVLAERVRDLTDSIRREQETNDRLRAEQPRPLTADDITDEMVKRARRSLEGDGWIVPGDGVGQLAGALVAALTEPTEDPEVVALADVLGDFAVADEHNGTRDDMQLARLLHRRGVRVVTEEQP